MGRTVNGFEIARAIITSPGQRWEPGGVAASARVGSRYAVRRCSAGPACCGFIRVKGALCLISMPGSFPKQPHLPKTASNVVVNPLEALVRSDDGVVLRSASPLISIYALYVHSSPLPFSRTASSITPAYVDPRMGSAFAPETVHGAGWRAAPCASGCEWGRRIVPRGVARSLWTCQVSPVCPTS